ncbi:MAG: thrombospondin type 3 repeat-containing protein [Verrucomicrobiae bacterium]|nr:thrombospondin type 3 repeat-containing protein [Verrucomicrobiae bacterium]MDW8310599.1 thrombospondin type 3 repeat-containing protein [Verrucomicrobiales bacterium]
MKAILLSLLAVTLAMLSARAATTINPTNIFAYGANIGWINARGDVPNGAVIGEYTCSGYLWAANVGWIRLGSGSPANGIQYQNNSATDFGVNHDGLGNLRGYAWGANIGWLNFESNGAPRVDLTTGKLSGYVWSANCGWISLSNVFAMVQTDTIASAPDTDGDGLADAWERLYFGDLAPIAGADPDGDGMNNLQEYLAGTNPLDASDNLRITVFATPPGGTAPALTWKSTPARRYFIEKSLNLTAPLWLDSGLGLITPDGAGTTRTFADTNAPMRFYRVRAVKPLSP